MKQRLFSSHFPSALKRTMKTKNDFEKCWLQKHLSAAMGFYELQMLDEAERELSEIHPQIADQSVPILTLRLAISYCRSDWSKMKDVARKLFLLDSSNPKWPFSDGYATAKIDSMSSD
jgi:hypothetical protein